VYQKYKEKAEFYVVYIREAHPDSEVTVVKDGKPVLEKVGQTSDVKERRERAGQFAEVMKLTVPVLVDKGDDKVNAAYAGWPERLYVVGTDGKIAYKGGPGPGGFKIAEVESWLDKNAK
jgi:hypothetical protein